jgi:predicted aspartyl protease
MKEVRVEVRLTNALDAMLAHQQSLPARVVRTTVESAMVDTGAVCSIIPEALAKRLGIVCYEQREARFADGRQELVGVTEPILFELAGRKTFEEAMVLGDEVLIGQTVLEKTDLLVDCANGCVVPNPKNPQRPVLNVKVAEGPSA